MNEKTETLSNELLEIPYIVYENSENRHEKKEKRYCICIVCLALTILMIVCGIFVRDYFIQQKHNQEITDLTNSYIEFLNQYEFESYAQDGTGTNILGNSNEVNNGASTMENEEEERQSERKIS